MTKRFQTEVDALAAPADDGGILVWPDADTLLRLAEENRRRRESYRFEVLGRPAQAMFEASAVHGSVIMTGHQPVFFHPGVWAKHVVVSALAERLGGEADFLVVDSDAVRGFSLRWPERGPQYCRVGSASPFTSAGDRSYEQLRRLPADHWKVFFARTSAVPTDLSETAIGAFVDGFVNGGKEAGLDYVNAWGRGLVAADRLLDVPPPRLVRVSELFSCETVGRPQGEGEQVGGPPDGEPHRKGQERRASPLVERGDGVSVFVAHMLLNAQAFAAAYNETLAEYRRRRRVRGRWRPMPDLAVDGERVELPLWVLHGCEPRQRLFVSSAGADAVRLWAGAEPICLLGRRELFSDAADALSESLGGCEVRPRALTLMMYARLFACDLFIHGVGGAKYDQIADGIIRRFFGVEPPAFACVSATLRLRLPAYEVSKADRLSCRRRLRDIKFNPQRHLVSDGASPGIAAMIAERQQAIGESDRLRQAEPRNRAARKAVFGRIRQANEALLRAAPGLLDGARHELATVDDQLAHNRIAQSREWFFALHPVEKLRALREALPFSGRRDMS